VPERSPTVVANAARELPKSIHAAPLGAWGREQVAELPPQQIAMLDYKLGVLSRLERCLSEQKLDKEAGSVTLFFHYSVDPSLRQARGTSAGLLDSSLSREADAPFLQCLEQAHAGASMPWHDPPPSGNEFHWATDIVLPLEDDGAYDFFEP
jgi:hypothetical protein